MTITDEMVARVADAIENAQIGYRIELTRLVDGIATYECRVDGLDTVLEFESHSDALDFVTARRREVQARAAILAAAPTPPSTDQKRDGEETSRSIGIGMAMAAGIIMACWGDDTRAREILTAAGFNSVQDLIDGGVDEYDINLLRPALRSIDATVKTEPGQ